MCINYLSNITIQMEKSVKWVENDFGRTVFVGFIGKVGIFNIDKCDNTFKLWDNSKKHFHEGTIECLKLEAERLVSDCT